MFAKQIIEDLGGWGALDEFAASHKDHWVGDTPGEAHLARRCQRRHTALGTLYYCVGSFFNHFGIKRICRLVEQHELRFHAKRPGDGEMLLLPAGW